MNLGHHNSLVSVPMVFMAEVPTTGCFTISHLFFHELRSVRGQCCPNTQLQVRDQQFELGTAAVATSLWFTVGPSGRGNKVLWLFDGIEH